MMKRLMTVTLAAMLMMALFVPALTASARIETVNFALSANDAEVGDITTVSVTIPADSYFTNATMHIHYDSTVLSFIEEGIGSASARGAMFMANDKPAENEVTAAYVTINGIKKGGVLVTFDFEVLKKVPTEVTLTFNECVGVDADDVEFDVNYTTEGCIINNDGSLTAPAPSKPTQGSTAATEPGRTEPTVTHTPTDSGSAVTTTLPAEQQGVTPSTTSPFEEKPELSTDAEVEYKPITVTDAVGTPVTEADGTVVTSMVAVQKGTASEFDMTTLIIVISCLVGAIVIAVIVLVIVKKKNAVSSEETGKPNE